MLPLAKSPYYNTVLRFLVAIAIGTLLGDALIHLLPHALIPHTNNSGHGSHKANHNEPIFLALTALLASVFMYTLENLIPLLSHSGHHNHSHSPVKTNLPEEYEHKMSTNLELEVAEDTKGNHITPAAFMVIIGDGLHNITDGLAIGAAFVLDPITGFSTAIAVICHELPHEIGDFAMLLKTGVSFKKAFHLNIISSILSIFGEKKTCF